jgi:YVTN family beta-propeller protein
MSTTPDSTHVYVANQAGPSVSVIATATNTVSSTLAEATVGKAPYAILATSSPNFYEMQAGHGGWQSPLTAPVTYPVGWKQGGWQ